MSEHHPDMDLIMALAGGELPPEEAARIESQLDPEARAELAAQRAALARLGELGRPTMSADESRRLQAAVREALHLERDRPHAAAPRPRRRQWFARVLPALAAAASLVAVIAIAVNLTDRGLDEEEPFDVAATGAPATTAAAAATTTTAALDKAPTTAAAMLEVTVAAAEEAMEEEADMLADEAAAMAEAEAEAAMEEAAFAAEEPADSFAATTTAVATTGAPTTLAVTDTTESLTAEGELPSDFAFAFSTDRPDEAYRFTDMIVVERGEAPFPLVELADRAAAKGLVCWAHVADTVDPGDYVSFMGYGLVDGEAGEAYRIEPGPDRSREGPQKDDPVLLLFTHPECRPIDLQAG